MEPLKLKLSGFAGIASGRGKPDIEIDFRAIEADARIVALIGPNGAGKTTVMDNMHPYRVMPSRASSPSPSAYSYYDDLVAGAEGLKDLTWTHEGVTYQSVIRMKVAGKTKKQECYLFVLDANGKATPYRDACGLVSDGKADTYDRAVQAVCGRPDVFFASLFSAQGKRPISAMTVGEVKALMASMLRIENLKVLGERATDVVRGLRPHMDAVKAQTIPLQEQLLREQSLHALLEALNTQTDSAASALTQAAAAERAAVAKLVQIETAVGQQESVKAQHAALTVQRDSSEANRQRATADLVARQAQERTHLAASLLDLEQSGQGAARALEEAQRASETVDAMLAREPAVSAAEANRAKLRDQLAAQRNRLEELSVDAERMQALRASVLELSEALARGKADGVAFAALVETARNTASLVDVVPCKGHAFQQGCQLLSQANAAAAALPAQEARISMLRDAFAQDRRERTAAERELKVLIDAEQRHAAISKEVMRLTDELNAAKSLAAELPAILDAKARVQLCRARVVEAHAEAQRIAKRRQQVQAELTTLEDAQAKARKDLDDALAREARRILSMIEALPWIVEESDLQAVRSQLSDCEQRVKDCVDRRSELMARKQEAQLALDHIGAARASLSDLQMLATSISDEIANWTLLSRALGHDGIIAMSIDDAGPTLSVLCNSLLEDCYGGRFQVRLSTQQATAAGALRESFEVFVEDTLRGEEKSLSDMSGGEKVWINECLVRAMALYIAQSSDQQHSTLFCDEVDGPLDEQRKRQFMAMKRAVLERGSYRREYLITQTPQLWELCDARIDVAAL